MVRRVFKYPIVISNVIQVEMPEGAEILHIGAQRGRPMMWALVDPEAKPTLKRIRCAGTGHVINEDRLRFIETMHLMGDDLIFHFFEILE